MIGTDVVATYEGIPVMTTQWYLIITNCAEKIISIADVGRLGKSDHTMIMLEIEGNQTTSSKKSRKCWSKANWTEFKRYLENVNWQQELENSDANSAW